MPTEQERGHFAAAHRVDPLVFWLLGALVAALIVISLLFGFQRRAHAQSYTYLTIPIIALTNSAQSIKASPTTLLGYSCVNPNAAAIYVQVYDSVGAVVVGTTVAKFSFRVPPTSSTGIAAPQIQGPYYAAAGLQAAATTTAAGGSAPVSAVPCDFLVR